MSTAERYAPGGDIFDSIAANYGRDAAQRVFAAYSSRESGAVATALGEIRNGPATGSSSALANLANQLATDPLGAPLEAANRTLGNTVLSFLRAPLVLLALALVLFLWLGGAGLLKGRLAK